MAPNRRKMDSGQWVNVKVSEEAQVAARAIQHNFMPDSEMQEIYSLAILEYLHAYHPELEANVVETMKRRQEARREQAGYTDDGEAP